MTASVAIFPKEYLVLPMNTESRIFCNATNGWILRTWNISGFDQPFVNDTDGLVTDGIIIMFFTMDRTSSVLLLNTSQIAIDFITIECVGFNTNSSEVINEFLNVTIYGKFLY